MSKEFDEAVYYGHIINAELKQAMEYIKQFPEKAELYSRFAAIYEKEQYIQYDIPSQLNNVLTAYQKYFREVFFLCKDKEQATKNLAKDLAALLEIELAPLDEIEEKLLPKYFNSYGYQFMGGRTSGYYGPYIWQTTNEKTYSVELPDGVQDYTVRLLDNFIIRSWLDYISFGEICPGGWTDGDGIINCISSTYDLESENFKISLLKHEAQHARDLEADKSLTSMELEYRAKLVELIYSKERNLLIQFANEARNTDESNGHATAAYRIINEFMQKSNADIAKLSIAQIQEIAWDLFTESKK